MCSNCFPKKTKQQSARNPIGWLVKIVGELVRPDTEAGQLCWVAFVQRGYRCLNKEKSCSFAISDLTMEILSVRVTVQWNLKMKTHIFWLKCKLQRSGQRH